MNLVSIDPGIRGCGIAEWDEKHFLRRAYYVKNATVRVDSLIDSLEMAMHVRNALFRVDSEPHCIVLEFPQTYAGRAARGDTNDLLTLAAVDGAIGALFRNSLIQRVLPHQWKGSVNADVMIERIKDRLSSEETTCVDLPAKSLQHNVWDAVGIGLYQVGRLQRKRGFARG